MKLPPPIPRALEVIEHIPDRAVEDLLVSALPDLSPAAQSAAVGVLTRRGVESVLVDLVGNFRKHEQGLKQAIVAQVGQLHHAIRLAVAGDDLGFRVSALEVIAHAEETALAYLVADCLSHRCARTREVAAAALRVMVAEHLRAPQQLTPAQLEERDHSARFLCEALSRGLDKFPAHMSDRVVEASIWMAKRMEPALRAATHEANSPVTRSVKRILAGPHDPRWATFVWLFIDEGPLRQICFRTLESATEPRMQEALLRASHAIKDERIARACRSLRNVRLFEGLADRIPQMSYGLAKRAVRLVDASGMQLSARYEFFRRALSSTDEPVRNSVVRALLRDFGESATNLLTQFAQRGNDQPAAMARREVQRRRRRAGVMTAPPYPEPTGGTKGEQQGPDVIEAYFQAAHAGDFDRRDVLLENARSAPKPEPSRLRGKLASHDPIDRVAALMLARELKLVSALDDHVRRLAYDPDPTVRSLAVSMLAAIPGPSTTRILRNSLNDPDARVKANAVEALDELDIPDRTTITEPFLQDDDNRLRANAVRSMLRTDSWHAGEALIAMLEDQSRAHRLSALWLVENLELTTVLHRLVEISRSDPDEQVRNKAREVLSKISKPKEVNA